MGCSPKQQGHVARTKRVHKAWSQVHRLCLMPGTPAISCYLQGSLHMHAHRPTYRPPPHLRPCVFFVLSFRLPRLVGGSGLP